jgi:DnaJ-class molecular chaperone
MSEKKTVVCDECGGTGMIEDDECPFCLGEGRIEVDEDETWEESEEFEELAEGEYDDLLGEIDDDDLV